MPADVSALVAQMNETLAEIHATVAALNGSDHDAKLDALEKERDEAVQALQATFALEADELQKRRQAEDEAIAEKRRLEDEEIAARRRREDEERAEAKTRADEEMRAKLEAESREVEEEADSKMDEVEDEAQRMIEDGERRLTELEEKRKEINRMIDEQMRAPLPTAPARPRRARGTGASRAMPIAVAGAGAAVAAAAAGAAVLNSKPPAPETQEAAQSSDNRDVKAPETTEAAPSSSDQDVKATEDAPVLAKPEVAADTEVMPEEPKGEKDETVQAADISEPVEAAKQEEKVPATESIQIKTVDESDAGMLEPKDLDATATREPPVDHLSVAYTAEDQASSTTVSTEVSSRAVSVGTAGTSVVSENDDEIQPAGATAEKSNTQPEDESSEQLRGKEMTGSEKKSFFGSWGSKMKSLVAREQQANKSELDTANLEGSHEITVPAEAESIPKEISLEEQTTVEPSVSATDLSQDGEDAVLVIKNLDEEVTGTKAEVSEPATAEQPQVPESHLSVEEDEEESSESSSESLKDVTMEAKIAEAEMMPEDITEPHVQGLGSTTLPVKTIGDDTTGDLNEELVIRDLDAEQKASESALGSSGNVVIPQPEQAVGAASSDTHVSEEDQDTDTVEPGTTTSELDISPHDIGSKEDVKVEMKDVDSTSDGLASQATDVKSIIADESASKSALDEDKRLDLDQHHDDDKTEDEVSGPTAPEATPESAEESPARANDSHGIETVASDPVQTSVHPNKVEEPELNEPEPNTAATMSVQTLNVTAEDSHGPNGEDGDTAQTAPESLETPAPQDATNHVSERLSDLADDASRGAQSDSEEVSAIIALKDSNDIFKAADGDVSSHGDSELAEEAVNMSISSKSPTTKPAGVHLIVDDKMNEEQVAMEPVLAANEDAALIEPSVEEGNKKSTQDAAHKSTIDEDDDSVQGDEVAEKVEYDQVPIPQEPAATKTETPALATSATSSADEKEIDDGKLSLDSVNLQTELSATEDKDDSVPDLDQDTTFNSESTAEESILQDHLDADHVAPQANKDSGPEDFSISEFQEHMLEEFTPAPKSPMADSASVLTQNLDKSEASIDGQTESSKGPTSSKTNRPPSPPTFPATEPSRARRLSNAAIPGTMSSGPANTTQVVESRYNADSERLSPLTPIPGTMSSGLANTMQTITASSRPSSAHVSPSTPIPGTMSTGSSSPSFGRAPTPPSAPSLRAPPIQIPTQLDQAPRGPMLDYIANELTPIDGPQTFVLGPTPTTPIGDRRGRIKHSRGPSTAAAELITPVEVEPPSAIESEAEFMTPVTVEPSSAIQPKADEAFGSQPKVADQETEDKPHDSTQPEVSKPVSQTPVSPVNPAGLGSSLADELSQASLDGQGDMLSTDDEYSVAGTEEHEDGQDAFRADHAQHEFRDYTPQQSFRGEEPVHDPAAVDAGASEVGKQQVDDEIDEKVDSTQPSSVGADAGAVDAVLGKSLSRPQTPVSAVSVVHAAVGEEDKSDHVDIELPAKDEVAVDSVAAGESKSENHQPSLSVQEQQPKESLYDGSEYGTTLSAHQSQVQGELATPTQWSHDHQALDSVHDATESASKDPFATPMQSSGAESFSASPINHAPAAEEGSTTVHGADDLFDDDSDDESIANSSVDLAKAQAAINAAATSVPAEQADEEAQDTLPKDKEVPTVLAPVQDSVDAFEQKILQHSPEYFPQSPVFSSSLDSGDVEKPTGDAETDSQKNIEAPTSLDVAAARQMTPLLVPTNPTDYLHDISPLALRQESPMTPQRGLADSRHAPRNLAETPLRYSMGQSIDESSPFDMHKEESEQETPHHEPMSWLQGSEAEHPGSASHSRENSNVNQQEEHEQSEAQQVADPSAYAPRDVTNVPWHARNDSVPMSLRSQTTLSSAPSSPIHAALPRDNREPVIRESWPAVPGQHQEYLAGIGAGASLDYSNRPRNYSQATTDYGRSRNVSEVSNFDPFGPTLQKSAGRQSWHSQNTGVQDKPLPPAPATQTMASNTHRNSVGAGSSPGSIFQRMRSVFEKPTEAADGSTESPSRSRPVSGVFVPVKASPRPLDNLDSAGTIREGDRGNRNSFVLNAAPKKSPVVSSYDLNKGYYYDDPTYGREENDNERSSLLGKAGAA